MIVLDNLHIGYQTKKNINCIFANINASFVLGELVGLMGDNGIGKSTLLKTLIGQLKPIKGNVLLDNKDLLNYSAHELSKLISIVTTDKIGGFNLTVFDVVALGRTPYVSVFGTLTELDNRVVLESLNALSIKELSDKLIDELSDGQKQKVMIAKSLAQQTPIIILDEPTAFLDYTSKHNLFHILKELANKQNKLIIVSSHDIDLMQKFISSSMILTTNGIKFKNQ